MGKTRYLFKKIRDTKGIFHAKMGTIEDRNGMDPTEAEDIKKRWQEYTEELYKKDLAAAATKSLLSCPTVQHHRWQPTRLSCPWDSPGKNTGVGCHFLLQCMKVKK